MVTRLKAFASVAVAGIGFLSCGSEPAPAPSTHTVTMEAVGYVPATVTVHVGDTIVWVNKDPFPHTATSQIGRFDSKEIAAGASWSFKPETPGEFPYECTFHPTMKAMVKVE
jgi:plastocyanin